MSMNEGRGCGFDDDFIWWIIIGVLVLILLCGWGKDNGCCKC